MTTHRTRQDVGPAVWEALNARAAALGLTLHHLCREVGLDPSIPSRWKRGSTPSLTSYALLDQGLAEREAGE